MAKQLPKKAEENTGEWLNTYADMVTLLLTFFVLLFCCSNLDETKMQFILQAFQSRGKYVNNVVADLDTMAENTGGNTDNNPEQSGGEGENPQTFDELYQFLAEYIDNNNLSEMIAVEQGAAHLTIRFDDSVFFDGNSYILKQEGRVVLNGIIPAIRAVEKSIARVTISGHTADDGTDKKGDLQLSALRANSVYYHMDTISDKKGNVGTVEYSKYRLKACGPNEPIAENTTREGMAKNRRVEIEILKNELDLEDPKVIEDILKHDFGIVAKPTDPDDHKPVDIENLPEGSIDKVLGWIDKVVEGASTAQVPIKGPSAVDSSQFVVSESGKDKDKDKDKS